MVRLTQLMEEMVQDKLNVLYASMSDDEFFSHLGTTKDEMLMEDVTGKIAEILAEQQESSL